MKLSPVHALILALPLALSARASAQINELPSELVGVDIDAKPGAALPRDVRLVDQDGKAVTLGDYFDGERPVVLVFAYFRCPMLCSLVLKGVGDGLKQVAWDVGRKFRVVVVSIDPTDTPEMARAKRKTQLEFYGRPIDGQGAAPRPWDFLVGDEREVRRATSALGFQYRYDAAQKQYAHAAGIFVLTPEAKLSRVLFGVSFPEKDLRLALTEASQGRLGGAWEKMLLLCYHYDPQARGYVLAARRVMQVGGILTVLVLGLLIARMFRGDRRRRGPGQRPGQGPGQELIGGAPSPSGDPA